jgi:hypothetical protein
MRRFILPTAVRRSSCSKQRVRLSGLPFLPSTFLRPKACSSPADLGSFDRFVVNGRPRFSPCLGKKSHSHVISKNIWLLISVVSTHLPMFSGCRCVKPKSEEFA